MSRPKRSRDEEATIIEEALAKIYKLDDRDTQNYRKNRFKQPPGTLEELKHAEEALYDLVSRTERMDAHVDAVLAYNKSVNTFDITRHYWPKIREITAYLRDENPWTRGGINEDDFALMIKKAKKKWLIARPAILRHEQTVVDTLPLADDVKRLIKQFL